MDEATQVTDEEIDAGGKIEVMDPTGHLEISWGRKKTEVDHAEKLFYELLGKGYVAFRKNWLGRKGKQAREFDPSARAYILEEAARPSEPKKTDVAPVDAAKNEPVKVEAERVEETAEEKAAAEKKAAQKKAAEEAEKKAEAARKERFESAKRARDEAAARAKAARNEHDEASKKCREARLKKDDAARSHTEAGDRERLATERLEAATKALEETQRVAADDSEAAKQERVAAATSERDAAAAALAEAKKAREEAEAKLEQAKTEFLATVDVADAARKIRNDADDDVLAKKSECDDAERDLKGDFEHEQTKKFDKKADHTMVPPYRGG